MKFIKLFSVFFVLSFVSIICLAKNKIYYLEPTVVVLDGLIRELTFPGQPNYESIKNGDADEKCPYLLLNKPIDIKPTAKTNSYVIEPESNVQILQVVVENDNDWPKVKEGNYVHITGTLFHAFTGHHHARVLIRANNIKVIAKNIKFNKHLNVTKQDMGFLKINNLQN